MILKHKWQPRLLNQLLLRQQLRTHRFLMSVLMKFLQKKWSKNRQKNFSLNLKKC